MEDSEMEPLSVGDTITVTDTVYRRKVSGTVLPSDMLFHNDDQRFDEFELEVIEKAYEGTNARGHVANEIFVVEMEDGSRTEVEYRGRCPITGQPGEAIRESNSQGATQAYVWER